MTLEYCSFGSLCLKDSKLVFVRTCLYSTVVQLRLENGALSEFSVINISCFVSHAAEEPMCKPLKRAVPWSWVSVHGNKMGMLFFKLTEKRGSPGFSKEVRKEGWSRFQKRWVVRVLEKRGGPGFRKEGWSRFQKRGVVQVLEKRGGPGFRKEGWSRFQKRGVVQVLEKRGGPGFRKEV